MWAKYKEAKSLTLAQMWKDLFDGEGLPVKIVPKDGILELCENTNFDILVPHGREHVADEIVRKI